MRPVPEVRRNVGTLLPLLQSAFHLLQIADSRSGRSRLSAFLSSIQKRIAPNFARQMRQGMAQKRRSSCETTRLEELRSRPYGQGMSGDRIASLTLSCGMLGMRQPGTSTHTALGREICARLEFCFRERSRDVGTAVGPVQRREPWGSPHAAANKGPSCMCARNDLLALAEAREWHSTCSLPDWQQRSRRRCGRWSRDLTKPPPCGIAVASSAFCGGVDHGEISHPVHCVPRIPTVGTAKSRSGEFGIDGEQILCYD